MGVRIVTAWERAHMFDMSVFRKQAECHCCSEELADKALEIVLSDGCDCDVNESDRGVRGHDRVAILIENVYVSCQSISRALVTSVYSQSIVVPESGSANGDGHAHDCAHGSWQTLAEHRMKPYSGISVYDRALKLARRPPPPTYVSSILWAGNLFSGRSNLLFWALAGRS